MERVRAEQERFKDGFNTFDNLWVAYRPGHTVVIKLSSRDFSSQWKTFVVSSITGGIYEKSTAPWVVSGWCMKFDGKLLGRRTFDMGVAPFDGLALYEGIRYIIGDADEIRGNVMENLISHGEMYYRLLRRQCKHHKGRTVYHPYNEVTSLSF